MSPVARIIRRTIGRCSGPLCAGALFTAGLVFAGLLFAALTAVNASAADAPGCKDPFGLKRFEGSSLVQCEKRDFAEYLLPTSPINEYDFKLKLPKLESQLDLEGKLQRSVYAVPKGPSSAEVFRNYKLDMEAKGFRILFEARGEAVGRVQGPYFDQVSLGGQVFAYSSSTARFATAVKEEGEAKSYISLYIVEFQDGYNPKIKAEKGAVYVSLDSLQVGELRDRMTVVSAGEIASSLSNTGRVALYGIQFDFNKADIKPESRPTLDEIGKYLKNSPDAKLYVVGHTDNVGSADSNMRLSQARAKSVAADLARTYGIAPARLRGEGVGLFAPIGSNDTEDGRAKNRRVELLPQ